MLSNSDRFGPKNILIGDTARFPLSIQQLGCPQHNYPRTWEVIAFGGQGFRHCVIIRRRHDGLVRCIAAHWWQAHADSCLAGGRDYPPHMFYIKRQGRHNRRKGKHSRSHTMAAPARHLT